MSPLYEFCLPINNQAPNDTPSSLIEAIVSKLIMMLDSCTMLVRKKNEGESTLAKKGWLYQ
uniref:Uncharacterized protein n=1 Tax=Salix viminalis TaxID=40686 RepID=A0A6N2K7W2_SALVM